MNGHQHPFASHYPQVANHIDHDPTPKDQAVYVPSVSPGYAIDAYAQNWKRALPQGVGAEALDFLNPANRDFFSISHVMSSAGQALNQSRPCIITQRNRKVTCLILDSGGYQLSKQRKHLNAYQHRLQILRWMEQHGDYAMTLDVPSGPVLKPGYPYATTNDCLSETLDHLEFFRQNLRSPDLKLLNVLQGNNREEADIWYDSVKGYDFSGWAFAGVMRHNMYEVCRRILIMADENQIQDKVWIHVLGTCELETAVMLTALQRAINQHINPRLRISFDTSSPFLLMATKQIYTVPSFSNQRMSMPSRKAPDDASFVNSPLPWPWPSPMGNLMTIGDVCINRPLTARGQHDTLSGQLMVHHNLAALCWAIALANRVFDVERMSRAHTIVPHVGAAVEAIETVIKSGSEYQLSRFQTTFANLRHGYSESFDSGDDDRPVF